MSASSKQATQTNDNQATLAQQQQTTQSQLITAQQQNDALINRDLGTGSTVPQPAGIPSVSAVMGPTENAILSGLTLKNLSTAEGEAAAAVDPNETGILATFANSAGTTQRGLSANSADTLEALETGQATTAAALTSGTTTSAAAIAAGETTLQASLAAQNDALTTSLGASSAASQYAMAQEAGGGGQGVANPLGPQVTYVASYGSDGGDGSADAPAATSTSSGLSPVVIIGVLAVGGGALWWFERGHKKAA